MIGNGEKKTWVRVCGKPCLSQAFEFLARCMSHSTRPFSLHEQPFFSRDWRCPLTLSGRLDRLREGKRTKEVAFGCGVSDWPIS